MPLNLYAIQYPEGCLSGFLIGPDEEYVWLKAETRHGHTPRATLKSWGWKVIPVVLSPR